MQESNKVKPDEFRVGDVVWDVVFGKGSVYKISEMVYYSIKVKFENGFEKSFTPDGKFHEEFNRTLFFSEPKVEASVTRPFVPTLVGKRVVVLEHACYPQVFVVTWEDESMFGNDEYECIKSNSTVYEVSSENLLTSKK